MSGMTIEEWRENQIARTTEALESIARSLEKIANPSISLPGPDVIAAADHIVTWQPGVCDARLGDQWVRVRCEKHEGEPPRAQVIPGGS